MFIDVYFEEVLKLLRLMRPMTDSIDQKPLPVVQKDDKNKAAYAPEDGGFAKTFSMAEKVLPAVSPELHKRYTALQRDGNFMVNLLGVNNASGMGVNVNIANNPASLEIIGHEIAHIMTPGTQFSLFGELASITTEMLISEELSKQGVKDAVFTARRFEYVNTFAREATRINLLFDMIAKLRIDFSAAKNMSIASITGMYSKVPSRDADILANFDNVRDKIIRRKSSVKLAKQNMLKHSGHEREYKSYSKQYEKIYENNDLDESNRTVSDLIHSMMSGQTYEVSTLLSVVLAEKIKNKELTLEHVYKTLRNSPTPVMPYTEKLGELGIITITDEMVNTVHSFAGSKCEQAKNTRKLRTIKEKQEARLSRIADIKIKEMTKE